MAISNYQPVEAESLELLIKRGAMFSLQGLSQDLETGCLKFAIVNFLLFKGLGVKKKPAD